MKHIIALMVALMLAAMMFNIKVSATDINGGITSGGGGSGGNRSEYGNSLEAFLNALGDYINGDITIDDFLTVSNKITTDVDNSVYDRLGGNYIEGITSGIVNAVDKFGDNAQYYISEWYEDFLKDYTDLSQIESSNNPDKQGGDCLLIVYDNYGNYSMYYGYGTGVIRTDRNRASFDNIFLRRNYNSSGSLTSESEPSGSFAVGLSSGKYKLYGDWVYSDGTQAPTDDEFVDTEVLDFSDTSDDELEKLLEDLLNKLNLEMPDLSTMEGLLESIYNRLGTLDSDNDNALLNDINFAIVSLMSSNDKNTQEIVNALLEIRDGLKNDDSSSDEESGETGDSGTTDGHPNHIIGTLYNVKPLDKNWLNKLFTDKTELKVEYQGNKYYLESCGCLLLDDKYYSVDMNYDSYTQIDYDFSNEDIYIDNSKYVDFDFKNYNAMWLKLSSTQKDKINDIINLVYKMLEQSVPYALVTTTLQAYQGVIFNVVEPKDIVLSFDETNVDGATIGSFDVTILSSELFSNDKVKSALGILKSFLTVVIGYAWLLSMRKKVVGMLG